MNEEPEQFGLLRVYRERGAFLMRREMPQPALHSYEIVAKAHPEDVKTLLGISRVCMDVMLLNTDDALKYAQMAMELEPNNPNVKSIQATSLYFMSEFEKALIYNNRGFRLRKQPPYFAEGRNIAIETIQDCVGDNAGPVMIDLLPVIKKVEKKRFTADEELFGPVRVSRIPKPETKVHTSLEVLKNRETLGRIMALKYLGRTANEKFFLTDLETDKRVNSANSNGSVELLRLIKEGIKALSDRQEMLRTRKPYYHIKYSEAKPTKQMLREREEAILKAHNYDFLLVSKLREKLEEAAEIGDTANLTRLTIRIQTFLNRKSKVELPEKINLTEKIYRVFAKGFLQQFKLDYSADESVNARRIQVLMGMECGRARKFDPVLSRRRVRPCGVDDVIVEYRNIISNNQVQPSQLRCFMLFEIASMALALKEYTQAKYYSKRCMKEAEDIDSSDWWFNAMFVMLSVEMQLLNTTRHVALVARKMGHGPGEAMNTSAEPMDTWAPAGDAINESRLIIEQGVCKTQKVVGSEPIRNFLEACMTVAINAAARNDEKKSLMKRQKEILSVIEEEERVNLRIIFKSIWSLPPGRRFSVMPKRTSNVTGPPERRLRLQQGMTVVPGAPRALTAPPHSSIPGFQIFDI